MSGVQRIVVLADPDTDMAASVSTTERNIHLTICEHNVSIDGCENATALEQAKQLMHVLGLAIEELESR